MSIVLTGFIKARGSNLFVAINDCTCEGHNVMYECTVFGNGATIWKGTAFDCSLTNNELAVFHTINFMSQRPLPCNNGAIVGRAVRAEKGSYTSQITVQVSDELRGTTVVCSHDNGTLSTEIGSAILSITKGTYRQKLLNYLCINKTQIHFLHQLMSSLLKLITQASDLTGVMFHHTVHHFSTTLWQTTVESVPMLPLLTWPLVLEITHT